MTRISKISGREYWATFKDSYQGPSTQAEILETRLAGLPYKTALVDLESSTALFNELRTPWIPALCERYNLGGMKVLGGRYAPPPRELAYFFSHLLSPSIKDNHNKYPGILASGIEAGFLAIRELKGGKKKVFRDLSSFTGALWRTDLDILNDLYSKSRLNSFAGKVQFLIIDEQEVYPAMLNLDCAGGTTAIIVRTGLDLPQLVGRLVRALGNWDLKFSSGHITQHVWMNGAELSTVLDISLGAEKPLRLIGAHPSILSVPNELRSVVLHEIAVNIQKLAEEQSWRNRFFYILMLLNLGKLRWLESDLLREA